MLSEKINLLFKERAYIPLTKEEKENYTKSLAELEIPLESDFAQFNLLTVGPSFEGRGYELYNVCWFHIYSNDLHYAIKMAENILQLPKEYLPISDFDDEGFFYNRKTTEVLHLELGHPLTLFWKGELKPQWANFNTFIEWFFEITT